DPRSLVFSEGRWSVWRLAFHLLERPPGSRFAVASAAGLENYALLSCATTSRSLQDPPFQQLECPPDSNLVQSRYAQALPQWRVAPCAFHFPFAAGRRTCR